MKLVILITLYFLLNQGNCHEIETKTARLGSSYNISCKIQNPELIKGCWIENPMGSLKILWSGAKWERGRLRNLDQVDLCGVRVSKAIESDHGIWKCILAIGTKNETVNVVKKIDLKIKQNSFSKLTVQQKSASNSTKEKSISLEEVCSIYDMLSYKTKQNNIV